MALVFIRIVIYSLCMYDYTKFIGSLQYKVC